MAVAAGCVAGRWILGERSVTGNSRILNNDAHCTECEPSRRKPTRQRKAVLKRNVTIESMQFLQTIFRCPRKWRLRVSVELEIRSVPAGELWHISIGLQTLTTRSLPNLETRHFRHGNCNCDEFGHVILSAPANAAQPQIGPAAAFAERTQQNCERGGCK